MINNIQEILYKQRDNYYRWYKLYTNLNEFQDHNKWYKLKEQKLTFMYLITSYLVVNLNNNIQKILNYIIII